VRKLEVRLTRNRDTSLLVGTLAEHRGRTYFEYAPGFLATGLNLSPFRLPFEPGLLEHTDLAFGPLPGLFDDSLPDGWGLLLMDRHFRKLGREVRSVTALERLAWLGSRTMGALTYHPPAQPLTDDDGLFDLHALALQAQDVVAGVADDVLPLLLRSGGSPGGARPKVLVGFDAKRNELRAFGYHLTIRNAA